MDHDIKEQEQCLSLKNIDQTRRVVGMGSNVVDVIYRVNQIAGPEEKTYIVPSKEGKIVSEIVGGVTLNHLAWSGLLDVPVGLFGFQGDDRYGSMIRDEMDRHGIDRSAIQVRDGCPSSFSIVNVVDGADRAIYMARSLTADTSAADVEMYFANYIRSAAIVTTEISQLPLKTVITVLSIAREAGIPTVLDVDVPPDFAIEVAGLGSMAEFEEILRLADVVKPSNAAALQIVEADRSEERAEGIIERYGASWVAITEGSNGAVVTDGTQMIRVPIKSVEARDNTGAGDAFLGGLVAGLYHGLTLPETANLANACGAVCCQIQGAFPQLNRSRDEVFTLYGGTLPALNIPGPVVGRTSACERSNTDDSAETIAGLNVVRRIADALVNLHQGMSSTYYDKAVSIISKVESSGGRVHVTGVGKSRHIAHKLAATLQSTGTRAYFLDPADCNHGDSGQVAEGDVVVALSQSGDTSELIAAVRTLVQNGATIIAITGNCSSNLARSSATTLHVPVVAEGGPLGLAPTVSTSCQLAVADGLAMALKADRGFTREDFARYHPGGSLGQKLKV